MEKVVANYWVLYSQKSVQKQLLFINLFVVITKSKSRDLDTPPFQDHQYVNNFFCLRNNLSIIRPYFGRLVEAKITT
jgi:hypothetical protein